MLTCVVLYISIFNKLFFTGVTKDKNLEGNIGLKSKDSNSRKAQSKIYLELKLTEWNIIYVSNTVLTPFFQSFHRKHKTKKNIKRIAILKTQGSNSGKLIIYSY